jgi:hypothetical protein
MSKLDEAVRAIARAPNGDALSRPFLDFFPVTGVSVATVGSVLGNETLTATDGTAERLDELQFDLGEGPCWDAMRSGSPVILADARASTPAAWPLFGAALQSLDVRAMFVFPVRVGPLELGAIDMYSDRAESLPDEAVDDARVLARAVSRAVLRNGIERQAHDAGVEPAPVGSHRAGDRPSRRLRRRRVSAHPGSRVLDRRPDDGRRRGDPRRTPLLLGHRTRNRGTPQ